MSIRRRHRASLATLFTLGSLGLAPASARAVTQPDGTVVPQGAGLQGIFTTRGESLDAVNDAAILPERFVPGCTLRFVLVTRGPALFHNSFGWYNVDPSGAPPSTSDLHALIPCDATPGFTATLDLRHEPAYRGGELGFFLRTPQRNGGTDCAGGDCCGTPTHEGYTYFTERRFNPDNMGASSYLHLLTYDSRATAQSFYFAWEDLYAGGDNNFTDFVAQVDNIVCSGAGASCDTGMPGVCAQGAQQCRAGTLQCTPQVRSSAERCDGLDNDCNGMTDDGAGLCGATQVCDRGSCVDSCLEGSCSAGQRCVRSVCVDEACATVTCNSGQRCVGGTCVGACEGVVCPGAQQCRAGRCADPCEGVTCDADQACVAGVCQPRCECRHCAADSTCGTDGLCGATSCVGVACGAGLRCVGGACVDACAGAVCPTGEHCALGQCTREVDDAGADAEAGADVSTDAPLDAVTDAGPDAMAPDARLDAGAADTGSGTFTPRRSCACSTPGSTRARGSAREALGALGLGALAWCAGRRRRG